MGINALGRALRAATAIGALGFVAIASATDAAPAPAMPAPAASASAPAVSTTASAVERGLAAVYSDRLNGRKTASGERYDRTKLTAAHKTLPFGTQVKVTNAKNQKSVVIRINDRGPTQAGRILDLSPAAAKALGIHRLGMGEVTAEVVGEAPKGGKKR